MVIDIIGVEEFRARRGYISHLYFVYFAESFLDHVSGEEIFEGCFFHSFSHRDLEVLGFDYFIRYTVDQEFFSDFYIVHGSHNCKKVKKYIGVLDRNRTCV